MAYDEITTLLGGWAGFEIRAVERKPGGTRTGAPQITIELSALPGHPRYCSRCGRATTEVHDVTIRQVRELPILDAETWLLVPQARVRCPDCGPTVEALPWLDRYARMTTRFADSVARLAQVLPVRQVAQWFGLSWDTVKRIDYSALAARLGPIDLTGVRVIAIDEFAIQRGHRYATTVVDPTTTRVLWVGRGRAREDVRPFFALLGPAGCHALEAAVMDMSEAYEQETRAHCPQAVIVYDLFHVVAKYGREVIDRVRVDEANRLRADRSARHLVKSARWLLLKNRENVTRQEDQVRLDELLAANASLMTVYVLKDDLKQLWRYRHAGYAKIFWQGWYDRAMSSGIEPLKVFARRLKPFAQGILAHCRWPLGTNLIEGINNTIKVIKRMAYGFRDDRYFFLKIRAAFPGNP